MDKDVKAQWAESLDRLMELSPDKRKHFALLLIHLAKCYADSEHNKAVVLVDTEDALLTFSVGADEMEAANMIQQANNVMNAVATADAPAKEMFN